VHRREVDSTRNLAKHLRISTIRLDASSSDAQAAHESRRNYAHLVSVAQSKIRDVKGLGAGFEHDTTVWLTLEKVPERSRRDLLLQQNLAVAGPNAKLGFLSAEIDCNMLRGRLSLLRLECVYSFEARLSVTSLRGKRPSFKPPTSQSFMRPMTYPVTSHPISSWGSCARKGLRSAAFTARPRSAAFTARPRSAAFAARPSQRRLHREAFRRAALPLRGVHDSLGEQREGSLENLAGGSAALDCLAATIERQSDLFFAKSQIPERTQHA